MRDLYWLRRERKDGGWWRAVSTAPRSSRSRGQERDGWGSVLLHPEWHTKHRDARLANAGSRHLAAGRFHSESSESCLTSGPHSGRSRGISIIRFVHWLGILQNLSQPDLRTLAENAYGERR